MVDRRPLHVVYETHSTTLDNEAGVATGWRPGELSDRGRREAVELGARRADPLPDLVVSSDLARAVETVELAFAGSPVERRTDPRLRECDYGALTGMPVARMEAERASHVDVPWPGGTSYRQVADAMRALLEDLAAELPGGRVLLVGHAAPRYALDHLASGRPLESAVAAPFAWRPGWEWSWHGEPATIDLLDGAGASAELNAFTEVYRAAFTAPGYDEPPEAVARFRDEQLPLHAGREGFRCAVARVAGEPVGFSYGYTGRPGQWWSDQVVATVPPELAQQWLDGHFEVVELALAPRHQGSGLAAALHDVLLRGLPHDRALLTTYDDDRPAPRLYRRLGWQLLHRHAIGGSDLYGLDLRTWPGRPRPAEGTGGVAGGTG